MKKIILLFLCVWAVTLQSCNKDDVDSNSSFQNGGSINCSIAGKIIDESGASIAGAIVQIGSRSYSTDANGLFYMTGLTLNSDRVVLKVTKSGYWERTAALFVKSGHTGFTKVVMPIKNFNNTVSGTAGGIIQSGNSIISFPANAFTTESGATYSGQVYIAFKDLPTTDPNFGGLTPGTDLLAEDINGDQKLLISYGMIGAELQDVSGNKIILAPGKKATITFPIAADQLAASPATIPLWHFSDDKNVWMEEGSATKQGNNYVGEVSHFTWWNCDDPGDFCHVSGYVKDCAGNPVPYTMVSVDGDQSKNTDNTGFYQGLVSINTPLQFVSCNADFEYGQPLNITVSGYTYSMPDLLVPCHNSGFIVGNLESCTPINNEEGILYVSNDSSGNYFIIPIDQNGDFSGMTDHGPSHFKAINVIGESVLGTINMIHYPDTTFLNTITICPQINSINSNAYSLDVVSNGCTSQLNILDSLTEDTIAFGSNNSAMLYLKDLDVSPGDTNISVNCLLDYQVGTQQLDTSNTNYINMVVTYNNHSIYLNSENGYVTFIKAGQNPGDKIDMSFTGICSLTNPQVGGGPCYVAVTFRTKFIRK
jgi:hypothetical protein